ncbi:MAG: hypothetical protein LKK13_03670 [Bacilli bacterium]|jgi:hypothetical protein|nr:hypothetical protein [Bacilli bacterium]
MRKHRLFAFLCSLLLALGLASCGEGGGYTSAANSFDQHSPSGSPGLFSLVSPTLGASLSEVPTFSWNASENATRYMLEIASSENFVSNNNAYVYYKHDYISSTSYSISAELSQKDVTYYWRVTAYCGNASKLCANAFTFFLKAPDYGEVPFPLGTTGDWSVHKEGAPVGLSMDTSDFFLNGQKSLAVNFLKEDTQNIGWIVLTKTVELDTYGTDAFYLRFFYSGQDAKAYIRLIDNDGEFWKSEIAISNNSKQIVILPFSSFTQTTQLVTTANFTFDYFHIKRIELVFEETWGDGVCLVSGLKCVKKSDYRNLFIDKFDFADYPTATWEHENGYDFGTDIGDDGASYTLHYDQNANGLNDVGMSSKGYAFTKIPVGRFFDEGDTVKMSLTYSGSTGSSGAGKASFRVYEEDGDLWYFQIPLADLSTDRFTTFYLPFASFASSSIAADGQREFGWIKKLQFGVTDMYGTGTLTYKDIEIVSKADVDEIDTSARLIGNDGLIEDFDGYHNAAEPFYQWSLSRDNKDEYIALDSLQARGADNPYCGKLTYKADMEAASYTLPIDAASNGLGYDGLSLWLKDASLKDGDAALSYLDGVNAKVDLAFTLGSGATAFYEIEALPKVWTKYEIPFSAFSFASGSGTLDCASISSFSIALSYLYRAEDGTADPRYTDGSAVYCDNVCLEDAPTKATSTALESAIAPDEGDPTKATIETAESYASTAEALDVWGYGNDSANNELTLSDDVSIEGGTHSLSLNYLSYETVNYALPLTIDGGLGSSFGAKGIDIDLKGDGYATVYLNFYYLVNGSVYHVRHTIERGELLEGWAHYELGFGVFTDYASPTGASLKALNVPSIYQFSIGIVNQGGSASARQILVDNIRFDSAIERSSQISEAL